VNRVVTKAAKHREYANADDLWKALRPLVLLVQDVTIPGKARLRSSLPSELAIKITF
jgi:hypothetical protein